MTKFIKKAIAIEAEQWFPGKKMDGVHDPVPGEIPGYVTTAHNQLVFLEPGDWVIPERDGRGFYPCKPDIFEATYDAIDDRTGLPNAQVNATDLCKEQRGILAELLHDIRNLDPTVEQLPGWQTAVESGALDGWV